MAAKIVKTVSLEDGEVKAIGPPLQMQESDNLSNASPIDLESNKFIKAVETNGGPA